MKTKENEGITLVALILTIIILLILAGITIGQLTGNGIFNKAQTATQKYGEAKVREALELALAEAEMLKQTEGLTDEQFVTLMESKGFTVDGNQITLEGYTFEVNKDSLKVISKEEKATGILISATVASEWALPANAKATVSGSITSTEGSIATATLAKTGIEPIDIKAIMNAEGNYTKDLTEGGEYTLTATDDKGNTKSKTINVVIKSDNTVPTIESVTANVNKLDITLSATGNDKKDGVEQSGIDKFKYTITPTTGLETTSGEFSPGETVTITSTVEETYSISVTAIDNVGNEIQTSNAITEIAKTINGMTIAEAKTTINSSNIKDYIGTKIIDYNPATDTNGVYRVFFLDVGDAEHQNGKYGDGANTIYLKRDYDDNLTMNDATYAGYTTSSYTAKIFTSAEVTEITNRMKKMNPLWATTNDANGHAGVLDQRNEYVCAYLCNPNEWTIYCDTSVANYAIGTPSVEMYMDAYNQWKGTTSNQTDSPLNYNFTNGRSGYSVGANGTYAHSGNYTNSNTLEIGPNNSQIFIVTNKHSWLASPSGDNANGVIGVYGASANVSNASNITSGVCPIVSLK